MQDDLKSFVYTSCIYHQKRWEAGNERKYQGFDRFSLGIDFETTLSPSKFWFPPAITGFVSSFDKLYVFAFQEIFIRFSLRCG